MLDGDTRSRHPRVPRPFLVGVAVLWFSVLFLTAGGWCSDGPDTPVMDTGEGASSTVLQEGAAGRVSDAGGLPIAGALIIPEGLDPDAPPIPEIAVLSGADGRFEWRLQPGRYRITASAPGYGEMTSQVQVEAGRTTLVDFTLEKSF